jgi:hypothetical protein
VTVAQRDRLLELHRASTAALERLTTGIGHPDDFKAYYAADDAFREYLYSLPVVEA